MSGKKKIMPYFSYFAITINTNKQFKGLDRIRGEWLLHRWVSNTFSDENLIRNIFINKDDDNKHISAGDIELIESDANKEIGTKFHRLHIHIIIRVRHWVTRLALDPLAIRASYKNESGIPNSFGGKTNETGGIGLNIKAGTDGEAQLRYYTLYERFN